eukprot:g5438.t1
MENQLENNLRSRAFLDAFEWGGGEHGGAAAGGDAVTGSFRSKDVKEKHILMYEYAEASARQIRRLVAMDPARRRNQCVGLQVTGLSWNATGSVLCVAYGRTDHSSWCSCATKGIKPAVCAWSVFRRDLDSSTPHVKFETQSCVTSIACHPENPALVAAGTFNGELLVLNTAASARSTGDVESLVARSLIDDYFHREPITSVEWIGARDDRGRFEYQIATVSGDGKVLLWTLTNKLVAPIEGYRLVPGRDRSMRSAIGSSSVGGTSLSFCKATGYRSDASSFVVGTESGQIMRCFRAVASDALDFQLGSGDVEWTRESLQVLSRVKPANMFAVRSHVEKYAKRNKTRSIDLRHIFASRPEMGAIFPTTEGFKFKTHAGPVCALDMSPCERNLFLSAGGDAEIRLYSQLQSEPVRVIDTGASYVFDVAWSATRPTVFAAATKRCGLLVFDLMRNSYDPVVSLAADDETGVASQTCVRFNPKQRGFVASGDAQGRVRIWKLPWALSSTEGNGHSFLGSLVALGGDEDAPVRAGG